jgi:hypothetical protein
MVQGLLLITALGELTDANRPDLIIIYGYIGQIIGKVNRFVWKKLKLYGVCYQTSTIVYRVCLSQRATSRVSFIRNTLSSQHYLPTIQNIFIQYSPLLIYNHHQPVLILPYAISATFAKTNIVSEKFAYKREVEPVCDSLLIYINYFICSVYLR